MLGARDLDLDRREAGVAGSLSIADCMSLAVNSRGE